MAGYKEIKGFQVQTRTEDPSPTEVQTGDFYYNSTTGQFKTINTGGAPVGTWASGAAVNTARTHSGGAGDSKDNALFFGGSQPPNTTSALTEKYDGSSWTEVSDLNTARIYLSGTGSSTAAITASGGSAIPQVESWDGSSWTEIAELNTPRGGAAMVGTTTSALAISGYSGGYSPQVEQWNGSAWTEISDVNYGHYGGSAAGASVTSALIFGGENPPRGGNEQKDTELWDGSSWSEQNNMSNTRSWTWSAGTVTSALVAGGQPNTVNTEVFDGSSWAEVNNLATPRSYTGGKCGTSTNTLYASGSTNPPTLSNRTTATEEWTAADFQIKTVTTS